MNQVIAIIVILFLGIGIHEYAHCKVADMAGDPTPREHGRVTLNLFKHFEPLGTFMMVVTALSGFGIGWGRPAPINPAKMKNPRWDHFAAVFAGPLSNLCQAFVYAFVIRVMLATGTLPILDADLSKQPFIVVLLFQGVITNIALFLFNLLPIGPLDGMWILGTFLPDRQRIGWYQWNMRFGGFLFLGLVLFSQYTGGGIFAIIAPLLRSIFRIFTGFTF